MQQSSGVFVGKTLKQKRKERAVGMTKSESSLKKRLAVFMLAITSSSLMLQPVIGWSAAG